MLLAKTTFIVSHSWKNGVFNYDVFSLCETSLNDPNKQVTELLYFCKKDSPNHPSLFFNGTVVPKVNEQKCRGLILDSK